MADGRVTQLVAETLSLPTPAARLGQCVVETLGGLVTAPVPGRVTQLLVETLTATPPPPGRVSQLPLEILDQWPTTARLSQAPLETVEQWAAALVGARVSQAPLEILYPFGCYPRPVPAPLFERRVIRRLRRAPHVQQEHRRIAYAKFALDLQRGVGLDGAVQGSDPRVMLRVSRDGGQTWSEPVTMPAGKLGAYTTRVIARRLGHARDAVFEVTVSDPVAWSLVQAWLDLEPEA